MKLVKVFKQPLQTKKIWSYEKNFMTSLCGDAIK